MKKIIVMLIVIVAAAVYISGCGGGSSIAAPQSRTTSARILSISPSDGTSGVATDTVFTVSFSQPMNMSSVDDNIHVYQGTGTSGSSLTGNISWNDMHTMMTFVPDQGFMPGTTHTVHFGTGMMSESGGMMMNMSGSQMMNQDMYTYFTTR